MILFIHWKLVPEGTRVRKISQLALSLFIFLSFFCRTSGGKILHLNVCSLNSSLLFHPCNVSAKESPGVVHVMCNLYDTHSTSPRTYTLPVPFSSAKQMSLFLLAFLKHHLVVTLSASRLPTNNPFLYLHSSPFSCHKPFAPNPTLTLTSSRAPSIFSTKY
jgi:hypothetical protein